MAAKLQITGLEKSFDGVAVLKGLDFQVGNGEFLSILGESGCGKTTLLRILIGLLPPDGGQILCDGRDITKNPPAKRGMGIVFQNYALFQNMTALENVAYALTLNKETKATAIQTAREILEQVGMGDHCQAKPHHLSGGQQQRVAIARTLAQNPAVILLDEPLSALDVENRLSLREEIKRLQGKYHTTMIYVTHDQEEAFTMSDRIMVMDRGVIAQIGTGQEILSAPATPYVAHFVVENLQKKCHALQTALGMAEVPG